MVAPQSGGPGGCRPCEVLRRQETQATEHQLACISDEADETTPPEDSDRFAVDFVEVAPIERLSERFDCASTRLARTSLG